MGAVTPGRVTIGVDPGQRIDPTAICVVEEVWGDPGRPRWVLPAGRDYAHGEDVRRFQRPASCLYEVRAMERLLQEPYPDVARRVAEIALNTRRRRPSARVTLVLDVTGLGRPVRDMLWEHVRTMGVKLSAVTLTAGQTLRGTLGQPEVLLGKAYLVSRLQNLLQERQIRLPANHAEAAAMLRELIDYEIKVRADDGHEQFGAFSTGAHDDLVTALGLATLGAYAPHAMRSY